MSEFDLIDSDPQWRGRFIRAGVVRYRHADGLVAVRDKVWHPGAVAVLPVDGEHVWLTRQPREVIGVTDSLEVPAGKLDVPGEPPLETGRRELAEEIGKQADHWEEICDFYTSAGFTDERIWLFLATGLSDAPGGQAPEEDERIEILRWPLARLDEAIAQCHDAKSVIALQWLALRQEGRR
jgi:ADP-ribose pyrophosphatase